MRPTMRRVLLADDDPLLLEIAGEYLRQAGYAVTTAADGRAALRLADGGRFDLIVTDIVMPELDGIELVQALKRSCPHIPVIAISAGIGGANSDLLLRAAQAVGAVAVLEKPLKREDFIAQVAAALAPAT
jgi:CheY-like chemotaxis protein